MVRAASLPGALPPRGYMTGSSGLPGRGASTQPAWYEAYPQSYRGHQGRVCAVCISCPAIVSPPAPLPGPAPCAEHACLANRLRQVQWSPHDDWLLSVGGSDCSLFQWRHIRPAWLRWWLRRTTPEREHLTATFGRTRPSIRPEYRLEGRVQVVAAGDLTGAEVQHRASKSEDQMTVERFLDACEAALRGDAPLGSKAASLERSAVVSALAAPDMRARKDLSGAGVLFEAAAQALAAGAPAGALTAAELRIAVLEAHPALDASEFFDAAAAGAASASLRAVAEAWGGPAGRRLRYTAVSRGAPLPPFGEMLQRSGKDADEAEGAQIEKAAWVRAVLSLQLEEAV